MLALLASQLQPHVRAQGGTAIWCLQARCEASEGEASYQAAEQSAASDADARLSTGTQAAQQPPSTGDSNAVAGDRGSPEAEAEAGRTAGAATHAPETGRSRQGQCGGAAEAERMGAVRRLSKQFSEQVTFTRAVQQLISCRHFSTCWCKVLRQ